MILKDVTERTLTELPQYAPLYPVYGTNNGDDVVVPYNMNEEDPGILLVNTNGDNLYITDWSDIEQVTKMAGFEWVEQAFEPFKKEFEDTFKNKNNPQFNYLLEQFRLAGGVLGLCEKGAAPAMHYSLAGERASNPRTPDFIKNAFNPQKTGIITMGASIDSSFGRYNIRRLPLVGINAEKYKWAGSPPTMIHELTHQVDHTINGLAQSPLFRQVLEFERLHLPQMLQKAEGKLDDLIKKGSYTEAKKDEELLARLHEEKLTQPEKFKKDLPVLNAFYENIVYPYLEHTLTHSTEAVMHLDKFIQAPFIQHNGGYRRGLIDDGTKAAQKKNLRDYVKALTDYNDYMDQTEGKVRSNETIAKMKEDLNNKASYATHLLRGYPRAIKSTFKTIAEQSGQIAQAAFNNKEIPVFKNFENWGKAKNPLQQNTLEQIRKAQKTFLDLQHAGNDRKKGLLEMQYNKSLRELSEALVTQMKDAYPNMPVTEIPKFDTFDKNMKHKGETPAILRNAKMLSEQIGQVGEEEIKQIAAVVKTESYVRDAYQKIDDISKASEITLTLDSFENDSVKTQQPETHTQQPNDSIAEQKAVSVNNLNIEAPHRRAENIQQILSASSTPRQAAPQTPATNVESPHPTEMKTPATNSVANVARPIRPTDMNKTPAANTAANVARPVRLGDNRNLTTNVTTNVARPVRSPAPATPKRNIPTGMLIKSTNSHQS